MSEARQKAYERGVRAEDDAAAYLVALGYEILERRYKTKFGEVDLIARFDDSLIFVEVKAHKTMTDSLMAVNARTRKRIQDAALYYMSEHEAFADMGMRFDVMAVVDENDGAISIRHLDNAWMANT